ncbi:STAS domain-containing protein [Streptomyces sp. NBRC 110028]|uniref:STAS domain-containing protein n=1 Tax=Streptomyces sp. NBRC 110028 TaxID=1621260 RepID=UPI00099E56F1|nr:STAS domain-containing protein [Streptomyces sp. NBRC 110028]
MPEPAQPVVAKCVGHAESDGGPAVLPPCPAATDIAPDGDRMRVSLRGELDLTGQLLRGDLHEALRRSASGVDLDLTALTFCDCSGLNILLDLRQRALGQGKTVVIRGSGPAVERLLDVTATWELFIPPGPDDEGTAPTARPAGMPGDSAPARGSFRTALQFGYRAVESCA